MCLFITIQILFTLFLGAMIVQTWGWGALLWMTILAVIIIILKDK